MKSGLKKLKLAIKHLYLSIEKLCLSFPKKPFTPDGRTIGDIGEAIANLEFNVILDKKQRKDWDGYIIDSHGKKKEVQIKATQKDKIYLKKPPHDGILIVFQISKNDCKYYYGKSILAVWKSLKGQKGPKRRFKPKFEKIK